MNDALDIVFVHAVKQSFFWGFIDDIYIQAQKKGKDHIQVYIAAWLRFGQGDFNKNYGHVVDLLQCFKENLGEDATSPAPCSQ